MQYRLSPTVRRHSGFTLIELLVVIAIIAILAAILFPVFAQAREKARAAACQSDVKQISTGMLMYIQDYDETLPEPGLGGVFRNATDTGLGQFYKGVLPFHLAIQPYVKNYQVFGCPSDDKKQNASVDRSDMKVMLVAAGVPGAAGLPNYSNTIPFHEAVAKIFPNSYGTNYILSQTYGYTRRDDKTIVYGTDDNGAAAVAARGQASFAGRGRALTDITEPANTWILTELGAQNVTGTGGWYTTPGYLNDQVANGNAPRWRDGRRHQEGRHWLFVDGHVKWYKDAPFESSPGVGNNAFFFETYYNNMKVYTTPN